MNKLLEDLRHLQLVHVFADHQEGEGKKKKGIPHISRCLSPQTQKMPSISEQWKALQMGLQELETAIDDIYAQSGDICAVKRMDAIVDRQLAGCTQIKADLKLVQPKPQFVEKFQEFVAVVEAFHGKMLEAKTTATRALELHPASDTHVEEKKQEVEPVTFFPENNNRFDTTVSQLLGMTA